MEAITSFTCARTLAKSTEICPAVTPKPAERCMSAARLAAASRAFEGTQPVLRQSPPILCFSISTVETPKAAAAAATDRPPEPAPITQMSGVSVSPNVAPPLAPAALALSGGAGAPAQALHHYGHQCQRAECGQRPDQFRRQDIIRVEGQAAIGAAGGHARIVTFRLGGDDAVEAGPGEGKGERARNDAERGGRDEGAKPDPGNGRHQIDQEKRE